MKATVEHNVGQSICNEIGGAVLTVLGDQQPFTVQALIDCLQQAQCEDHDYSEIREKSMRHAIAILAKFTEAR